MSRTRTILLVAVGALIFAACGDDASSPATATPVTEVMVDTTEPAVDTSEPAVDNSEPAVDTSGPAVDTSEPMVEFAPWQQLTLTDVDGIEFTLGDFVGTPVFVENFATWCPKCREQLEKTHDAATALGDDAVFIALSVETDLDAGDIAEYAADNGFTNIRFAVMTPEFLAAISDAFGNSSINPPSTPHFIIDSKGAAGELATGSKDAQSIGEALLAAAM